jgi:hypothetical protein
VAVYEMTMINSIGLKAIFFWSIVEGVRHPVLPSLNNDIRYPFHVQVGIKAFDAS